MGTFGCYAGKTGVRKEQKEIFASQMMKLLNYGGMMGVEAVQIFGRKLWLLKPAEILPGGKFTFWFNYFEDDFWEDASFDAHSCSLWSDKIGSAEFSDVITAAYFLFEMYDDEPGFTEINGDIVKDTAYVGWLNHLLKTKFSMKKRFRLWENMEAYAFGRRREGYDAPDAEEVMSSVPTGLELYSGGTDLADLFFIIHGTESLKESELVPDTYPADVYGCRKAVEHFFCGRDEEEAMQTLRDLLRKDRAGRESCSDPDRKEIAEYTLFLPARVIVYLTAELRQKPFWRLWKKLCNSVYRDEIRKRYAPAWLEELRRSTIEAPIPPVRTSDFLRQDGYFTFWNTPEELKGQPNYYISDDDRMYWWDSTDEVIISEEAQQWLRELAAEHREIMEVTSEAPEQKKLFLENFIKTLANANDYYKKIYPFQKMFYEFIDHSDRKEYRAAVELFRRLCERNREKGRIIEKAHADWSISSRNVTHNIARLQLKRYLSVMANVRLREKYFGF